MITKKYKCQYYLKNRDKLLTYAKNYYYTNIERRKEYKRQRYKTHPTKTHIRYRQDLVILLGQKCSNPDCLVPNGCIDIRCLQIDHRNGGGSKEVKKFNGNNSMYVYYLKHPEEAKEKLQVLCANCNWIKVHENRESKGNGKKKI